MKIIFKIKNALHKDHLTNCHLIIEHQSEFTHTVYPHTFILANKTTQH